MADKIAAEAWDSRPLHPESYQPHLLHMILVLTDLLGRIRPILLTPAWIALGAIACWPWERLRPHALLMSLLFIAVDAVGLSQLPRRGRSYGPVTPPLLALAIPRAGITFAVGMLWPSSAGLICTAGLHAALAAAFLYGTWVEPFRIAVTSLRLRSPKLTSPAPLRLLHISDLHVERVTLREEKLLRLVEALAPDVIVLTGDYLNLSFTHDAQAQSEARQLAGRLCDLAAGSVYAVTGSPPVDQPGVVPEVFEGLPITWLLDRVESASIKGQRFRLAGLHCEGKRSIDAPRLQHLLSDNTDDSFTLLLYHTPDLIPEAADLGVDLYLCGHTHGGQVRLPIFGALVTSSAFWKRYEMGWYQKHKTVMYVSRGLGLEGLGAPRVRFLASPEVVLWTLSA